MHRKGFPNFSELDQIFQLFHLHSSVAVSVHSSFDPVQIEVSYMF